MTLGGYITLLASLAGLGAASASQDPTFESPTFAPVFAPDPAMPTTTFGNVTVYQQDQMHKLVSVAFTGAGVHEVVDWLTKQGVNFMLNESGLPSDKKISLNLVDQPLSDVVDALGDALGGHWEHRGKILVFRNGAGLRGFPGLGTEGAGSWDISKLPQMEGLDKGMIEKGLMSDKDWQAFNKSLQQKYRGRAGMQFMQPGFNFDSKALEKSLLSKDWSKLSEAQAKEMAEMSKKLQKDFSSAKFKDLEKSLGDKDWTKLSEAQAKEMAEMSKKLQKDFNSAKFMDLEKSGMSQKEMDKLRQSIKKQMEMSAKDRQFMSSKDVEKMTREMQSKMKLEPFTSKGWEGGNFDFGGQDLGALAKSLTKEQREIQKRQGFLRVKDLTPAQRRYLGRMGSGGDWTLKYQNGGDEITIKGDRS